MVYPPQPMADPASPQMWNMPVLGSPPAWSTHGLGSPSAHDFSDAHHHAHLAQFGAAAQLADNAALEAAHQKVMLQSPQAQPQHGEGPQPSSPQGQAQVAFNPGPPIQMVPDGHGPDGCNLFVFHIPNEMSNLDLFNAFTAFGSVISARIMVDNDSGRSRGFGFVSFDNPASAADAIDKMNGLQIGKKRLKVAKWACVCPNKAGWWRSISRLGLYGADGHRFQSPVR
jgi:hypothetical protein